MLPPDMLISDSSEKPVILIHASGFTLGSGDCPQLEVGDAGYCALCVHAFFFTFAHVQVLHGWV